MSWPTRSATDRSLGIELVHAIAAQDAGVLLGLFSTPVTFRAVTPRRFWDAETAVGVADILLGIWFGPDKQITDITSLKTDSVGDVEKGVAPCSGHPQQELHGKDGQRERGRVGEQRGQSSAGEGGPAEQPQVDQRAVAAPLAPHEAGPGQRGSAKACSLTAVALS